MLFAFALATLANRSNRFMLNEEEVLPLVEEEVEGRFCFPTGSCCCFWMKEEDV